MLLSFGKAGSIGQVASHDALIIGYPLGGGARVWASTPFYGHFYEYLIDHLPGKEEMREVYFLETIQDTKGTVKEFR